MEGQLPIDGSRANSVWLMAERAFRLVIAVAVSAFVARALGPADFGQLTFAQQILTIALPLAALGSGAMSMKWFVGERQESGQIIFEIFCIRLVLALAAVLLAGLVAQALGGETALFAFLSLVSLIPLASSPLQTFFLSVRRGDLVFLATVIVLSVTSIMKLAVAYYEPRVDYLLGVIAIENCLFGLVWFVLFRRLPIRFETRGLSLGKAIGRFKQSVNLLPATFMAAAVAAIDFVILKAFSSDFEVGQYAAALRIVGAWVIVQAAMIDALSPAIMEDAIAPGEDGDRSTRKIEAAMRTVSIMSIVVALGFLLVGDWIALLVYGEQFADAAAVMMIYSWTALFVGWRKVSGSWLIGEGKLAMLFNRHGVALLVLVATGIPLAQTYGAVGVAFATVLASMVSGFFIDLLSPATRRYSLLKIRSLNPFGESEFNSLFRK